MTRWTRRDVLKAGATGALAAGALGGALGGATVLPRRAAAADAKYTLKLHHFLGPTSPAQVKMLAPWAKRVEDGTDGAVKIELYPSMSLGGKPPELIRQVRDGVVDIVWTVNGYTPGLFPRTEAFELPFVHVNDVAATNLAMHDLYASDLAQEYKGVKPLFLHVHAGQAIHMVDQPVHGPDDMKGRKIRIPTRTGAWVLEALGSNPVGMPVPELPQALSKKVVDGALIPWEIIPALKLQDLIKYFIEGPNKGRLGTTTFQVSMNQAKWDSLPKEIQAVFEKVSGPDWLKEVGHIWREDDDEGIEIATKAGGEHIVIADDQWAQFKEKLEPVVGRWVDEVKGKDIDGKKLVEAARAAIAKHTM